MHDQSVSRKRRLRQNKEKGKKVRRKKIRCQKERRVSCFCCRIEFTAFPWHPAASQNVHMDVTRIFSVMCMYTVYSLLSVCVFFVSRSSFLTFTLHLLLEQNFQSCFFPTLSFWLNSAVCCSVVQWNGVWISLSGETETSELLETVRLSRSLFSCLQKPALCEAGKKGCNWVRDGRKCLPAIVPYLYCPALSPSCCCWFDQVINGGKVVKARKKVSVSSR